MSENTRPLTYGEKAVGLTFNPSSDPRVDAIKKIASELIDAIHALRANQPNGEIVRMANIAITEIQTGQMWAVKAATWKY